MQDVGDNHDNDDDDDYDEENGNDLRKDNDLDC